MCTSSSKPRPVVAASELPYASRVIAFGHEGYISGCCGNNDGIDRLVLNSFLWLAENKVQKNATAPTIRIGYITGTAAMTNIKAALEQLTMFNSNLKPTVTWARLTPTTFLANATARDETDIWWIDTYSTYTDQIIDATLSWFKTGRRGLIVGGHIWYASYSKPNYDIYAEYPINHILWPLGMMITPSADYGPAAAPTSPPPSWQYYNSNFTTKLMADARANISPWTALNTYNATISQNFDFMLSWLPPRPTQFPSVTLANGTVVPGTDPYAALWDTLNAARPMAIVLWGVRNGNTVGLTASPYAAIIPGLAGTDTSRSSQSVTILCNYTGIEGNRLFSGAGSDLWRSTGLYAVPGQAVTVTVSDPAAVGAGLRIQIGAHTDDLSSKTTWARLPVTVSRMPVSASTFQMGSPLGGLIYVLVPAGKYLGNIQFTFGNVIQAPYFKLETTDLATWSSTIRNYPGPWAELETSKFIITVPSIAIRNLTNPVPVLNFWNQILDGYADLALTSRDRARAERFLLDVDISGGWMHSGYPIMAFNDTGVWKELLDEPYLRKNGAWGPFHEIGHNHQWNNMELGSQTTEAFVNIFSSWAMLNVVNATANGTQWGHYDEVANMTKRAATRATYLATGPNWSANWSVWTALDTYLQLMEGFGWNFYTRLYAAYRAMNPNYTSDTAARVQLFIVTTSQVANRNLVPFYQTWGFPITDATRANMTALALPEWVENPMKIYATGHHRRLLRATRLGVAH
ncbi:hypothetical protein HXX76_013121 [Chlamydomonas incerta]|uniref:Peptidase M60 domain-containing protein n=1 Tax=Chlamydomonas incerta TaxID=51695 RepID=A0A835SQG1_CHLIN|nr:hypothetical protein HXX76_013121 [Chlamydomonas incerta]|eukprot:KAG2426364.1 hypothetical protein HXX76_013121 [Chlamydomonas incerta]